MIEFETDVKKSANESQNGRQVVVLWSWRNKTRWQLQKQSFFRNFRQKSEIECTFPLYRKAIERLLAFLISAHDWICSETGCLKNFHGRKDNMTQHRENRCYYVKMQCACCYESVSPNDLVLTNPCMHGPFCSSCRDKLPKICCQCRTVLTRNNPYRGTYESE